MALELHFDCALEPLVGRLTEALAAAHGDDPFARDVLLVPSMGAGHWLRRQISDRVSVSCALDIDLPGRFLWSTVSRLMPGVAPQSPFEPAIARWILHPLLGRIAANPSLDAEQLGLLHARFSGRPADPDELVPLAQAIARQFSRLLNHRRDWLDAWARGESVAQGQPRFERHERWLGWLWREILRQMPDVSRQHPFERLGHWLRTGESSDISKRVLSLRLRRVMVFGMPQMSREQLSLLGQLAGVMDITFLVPDPCKEFWQDIVSPRTLAQIQQTRPDVAWLYESQPAVLGSWGRMHRDYLAQLRELEERLQPVAAVTVDESFRDRSDCEPMNRLQALKQAILNLSDAPFAALAAENCASDDAPQGGDASLQVHACPGLRRQVEVLRDRLLASFAQMPDLLPHEVLVVAPDISLFAEAIDGVFGDDVIPFAIEGRRRVADPVVRALLLTLAVAARPLTLDAVASLLEEPAVADALELDASEVSQLLLWLERAGFREDTGESSKHGWRAAIDRLWFGMAVRAEHSVQPYVMTNTLAVAGVSPSSLGLLAKAEQLGDMIEQIARYDQDQVDVLQWCELLAANLGRWFGRRDGEQATISNGEPASAVMTPGAHSNQQSAKHQGLLDLLRGLSDDVRVARAQLVSGGGIGVSGVRVAQTNPASDPQSCPLSVAAFARLLEDEAGERSPSHRVSGGVLFASVDSVRPYPARVTACLGFSDRAFPRQAAPLEFDLMQLRPRFGDPSTALADRGAFLDLICHTSERLLYFYDGADLRSNERLNPSILVAELIDYIRQQPGQETFSVIEHPLMRFLPASFAMKACPSFDTAAFQAATALHERERPRQAPVAGAVRETRPGVSAVAAGAGALAVSADDLSQSDWLRILARPARAVLSEVHRISLPRSLADTDRLEPLDIHDDLNDEFKVRAQALLDMPPDRADDDEISATWPLQPYLPQGASGVLAARSLLEVRHHRQSLTLQKCGPTVLSAASLKRERVSWRGRWLSTGLLLPQLPSAEGERLQFLWSAFPWNVRAMFETWVCHQAARLMAPEARVTTFWLGHERTRRLTSESDLSQASASENLQCVAALAAEVATSAALLFPRTWLVWVDKVSLEQRDTESMGLTDRVLKPVMKAFDRERIDPDVLILHKDVAIELNEVLQQTHQRYGRFVEGFADD